jgi:hypothetical protein
MDAQHVGALEANYNRWDHVFPVYAVRDGTKFLVPLSAVIYRTAMNECQAKLSRLLEQDLQEKTEQAQARRRENEKGKEVLRTASSIPHQEATSSLVKQMEKLIAPLKEEIRKLKEQGNTHALDATGPARVEERSGVNPRLTAQSRPDPRAEQRKTPQATIAGPQRGRKNGAEVQDRSAPKRDKPSPAIPNTDQDARANDRDAGKHRKRKSRRKGKGQAE